MGFVEGVEFDGATRVDVVSGLGARGRVDGGSGFEWTDVSELRDYNSATVYVLVGRWSDPACLG